SSNDRIKLKASSPYPSAGSSNAPSPGSAAAADWPRIGNASTARRSPSCASPPFASCCESYAIPRDVLGQTLRARWDQKARKFHGIATLRTRNVRYEADRRLCCVYDTALMGKPHHADVAGPGIKAESKGAVEKLRRQRIKRLIDNAVLRFEAAAEFRGGVLSRFVD